MKSTDFAMIFVAIIIPIIVVVYVDVSFLLKTEEQRLYYTNIINSAINDATYVMKTVEGEEQDVDYGYSGITEKKVSVNARIAIDTFFESLFDNFEIKNDSTAEDYIKSHIPALAIVDYNGIYIYSIDKYIDTESQEEYTNYVLKPKRYFTYTYGISDGNVIVPSDEIASYGTLQKKVTVQFTMDDYISVINDDATITSFYLEDDNNNSALYGNDEGLEVLKQEIIQHLKLKRSEIISDIVSSEMSFAINNHNQYSGVDYEFHFPNISLSYWDDMINNVGIIAFVQGIEMGNEKLEYVAHGISGLKVTNRYVVSVATPDVSSLNYYHKDTTCSVYKGSYKTFTGYYLNKTDAATNGYYPCPVCNP